MPSSATDIIATPMKRVRVTRNGIRVKGENFGVASPALMARLGEFVEYRLINGGIITVWDLDGKYVCQAAKNILLPFKSSDEEIREAIREAKSLRRKRKRIKPSDFPIPIFFNLLALSDRDRQQVLALSKKSFKSGGAL